MTRIQRRLSTYTQKIKKTTWTSIFKQIFMFTVKSCGENLAKVLILFLCSAHIPFPLKFGIDIYHFILEPYSTQQKCKSFSNQLPNFKYVIKGRVLGGIYQLIHNYLKSKYCLERTFKTKLIIDPKFFSSLRRTKISPPFLAPEHDTKSYINCVRIELIDPILGAFSKYFL